MVLTETIAFMICSQLLSFFNESAVAWMHTHSHMKCWQAQSTSPSSVLAPHTKLPAYAPSMPHTQIVSQHWLMPSLQNVRHSLLSPPPHGLQTTPCWYLTTSVYNISHQLWHPKLPQALHEPRTSTNHIQWWPHQLIGTTWFHLPQQSPHGTTYNHIEHNWMAQMLL